MFPFRVSTSRDGCHSRERRSVGANHPMCVVANNFWGKDDAGVIPLLDRMHSAKVTSEELKDFYHGKHIVHDQQQPS